MSYPDPPDQPDHPSISIMEEIAEEMTALEKAIDGPRTPKQHARNLLMFCGGALASKADPEEYRRLLVKVAATAVLAICDHDCPPDTDPDPSQW